MVEFNQQFNDTSLKTPCKVIFKVYINKIFKRFKNRFKGLNMCSFKETIVYLHRSLS